MKRTFSAWAEAEGDPPHALHGGDQRPRYANGEFMEDCQVLVFTIEAGSWEEAMAVYHLRQGWGPYKPLGPAAPCPECRSNYYPQGSGQCWHCGFNR